jgi:hypothetical protein
MSNLNQVALEAEFFKWHEIDSVTPPKSPAYIVDLWVIENAVGRKRLIPNCRFNPNNPEYKTRKFRHCDGIWEYQVLETTLGAIANFIEVKWVPLVFKPTHWRMTNQTGPEG